MKNIFIILALAFLAGCGSGNSPSSNEISSEGDKNSTTFYEVRLFEDLLTPQYYTSENDSVFKEELNNLMSYASKIEIQSPIKNSQDQSPLYFVVDEGKFGTVKGSTEGLIEHHTGVDLHFNNDTQINLYATFDGEITTIKGADKYRDYLVLSKNIKNDNNEVIGKISTIYAHIDLEKDENNGLLLNNTIVQKGDLVSKNLYASTAGGPHLHFAIRYYRLGENGDEEFYGFCNTPKHPEYTENTVEPWQYGCWNPSIGYGYANPKNHGLIFY